MAGTFFKQIPVFNRAPQILFVMFDGERHPIPPGRHELPEQTVGKGQNQNPVMGTGDPYNPGAAGTKYLIVMEDQEGYDVPLTQDEWEAHCKRPCREDETIWFSERYGSDPKAKQILRGSKHVAARSRDDAGGVPRGLADFTKKD